MPLLLQAQSEAERRVNRLELRQAQGGDPLLKSVFGDSGYDVKVYDAGTGKAVLRPQRDLCRNTADTCSDGRDNHETPDWVRRITGEEDYRPAPGGWWKVCPPHFASLHWSSPSSQGS